MTEHWNPNERAASNVMYDLSRWSFDQQAELAAELAEAGVPHTWDGSELVVPESQEAAADSTVTRVEARLGITYEGDDNGDGGGKGRGNASPAYDPIDGSEAIILGKVTAVLRRI